MPGNKADGAKMACSCEGLVPEGNLVIVERCEDKADAQQATRLKAARHFPQISKHSRWHYGVGVAIVEKCACREAIRLPEAEG